MKNILLSILCMAADPAFLHRVRFFIRNSDGRYSNFRNEDADFQDPRGYGYRLNNVSLDTDSNEMYRMIQDMFNGLSRSHFELQNTRIADITSPYSIRTGTLLPTSVPSVMRSLVHSTMPATRYMQIHVMLDPVRRT